MYSINSLTGVSRNINVHMILLYCFKLPMSCFAESYFVYMALTFISPCMCIVWLVGICAVFKVIKFQ